MEQLVGYSVMTGVDILMVSVLSISQNVANIPLPYKHQQTPVHTVYELDKVDETSNRTVTNNVTVVIT